jgi:fructosamine-3-kinase
VSGEPENSTERFVKRAAGAPEGFFASEAAGLRWLAESQAVRVPSVLSVGRTHISMTRVHAGEPRPDAAERFGRGLAALHAAGSDSFGAPWPGFIGPLPMDNGGGDDWASFYAQRRVLPFLEQALGRNKIGREDAAAVRAVLALAPHQPGADEPPSRIHGDLWSGNVLWGSDGEVWLIDPAAHGGHRETDLAMLALFGVPFFDRIVGSYSECAPLAPGWHDRVAVHQLHPLLVHALLFGGGYGHRAGTVAREALWRLDAR